MSITLWHRIARANTVTLQRRELWLVCPHCHATLKHRDPKQRHGSAKWIVKVEPCGCQPPGDKDAEIARLREENKALNLAHLGDVQKVHFLEKEHKESQTENASLREALADEGKAAKDAQAQAKKAAFNAAVAERKADQMGRKSQKLNAENAALAGSLDEAQAEANRLREKAEELRRSRFRILKDGQTMLHQFADANARARQWQARFADAEAACTDAEHEAVKLRESLAAILPLAEYAMRHHRNPACRCKPCQALANARAILEAKP